MTHYNKILFFKREKYFSLIQEIIESKHELLTKFAFNFLQVMHF
jgi:hypothetical protein